MRPTQQQKRGSNLKDQGKDMSFWGGDRTDLESALAMVASEACLVVDPVVGGQLVHQVHRLLTRHALLSRPCKRHSQCPPTPPLSKPSLCPSSTGLEKDQERKEKDKRDKSIGFWFQMKRRGQKWWVLKCECERKTTEIKKGQEKDFSG